MQQITNPQGRKLVFVGCGVIILLALIVAESCGICLSAIPEKEYTEA